MKIPIVRTEAITLRKTVEAASSCATWYWRASMVTIGMAGMAYHVNHGFLENWIAVAEPSQTTENQRGLHNVFQNYEDQDKRVDF